MSLMIPIVKKPPSLQSVSETAIGWLFDPSYENIEARTRNWRREHWNSAIWTIWVQGIAPMLYSSFQHENSLDMLPVPLQRYLSNQYRLNKERIGIMMAELQAILNIADQESIDIVPLKGSILLHHYYDKPGLRPMSDIDLLIHRRNLGELDEILISLGYRILEIRSSRHDRIYEPSCLTGKMICQTGEHPENLRRIEIHAEIRETLFGATYDITDDIWNGCQKSAFGDSMGMLMRPGDLLRHLVLHTTRHMINHSARFINLFDINLVISRIEDEEMQYIVDRIQANPRERILYGILFLLRNYYTGLMESEFASIAARCIPANVRRFLSKRDISHFSFCNLSPISPFEQLRCYQSLGELISAVFYLFSPHQIRKSYIGVIYEMLNISRYYKKCGR